ncbi:mevalonate kinase [Streptomyces laurentii]|uniref:mevalonate kinase family protein n=1 Tax=Streptomyces laurentii TaxID=39478 RepID=UPI00367CB2B9
MEEKVVFAPGNLFVIGEYAVLHGGRALVVAVDSGIECRVVPRGAGWWLRAPDLGVDAPLQSVPNSSGAGLLARAVRAAQALFPTVGPLQVTVGGRGWGAGRKIGLGGSAASVVAVLGALATSAGQDVTRAPARRALLPAALAVHRAHQQGRGSGADVAASLHGGWLDYRLTDGAPHAPHARPATVPAGLRLAAVWSGLQCDTPVGIDRFRRMGTARVEQYLQALQSELDRFWTACRQADGPALLAAVSAYGTLLDDLTHRLAPQAADRMTLLTRAAADCGAFAKSSGAVGGDCAIALALTAEPLDGARAAWQRLGAEILDITPDRHGLRPVPAGS